MQESNSSWCASVCDKIKSFILARSERIMKSIAKIFGAVVWFSKFLFLRCIPNMVIKMFYCIKWLFRNIVKWNEILWRTIKGICLALACFLKRFLEMLSQLIILVGAFLLVMTALVGFLSIIFRVRVGDSQLISGKINGIITGIFQVKINNGPDTDFLTIVGILLAFITLIGVAVYKWILRKVRDDVQKDHQKMRTMSRAEQFRALGVTQISLYDTLKESKCLEKELTLKLLNSAIIQFKKALSALQKLNKEEEGLDKEYLRQLLVAKNNIAHCISEKWGYMLKIDLISEESVIVPVTHAIIKAALTKDETSRKLKEEIGLVESCVKGINNDKNYLLFPDMIVGLKNTKIMSNRVFKKSRLTTIVNRDF